MMGFDDFPGKKLIRSDDEEDEWKITKRRKIKLN